jgi:DNA polymerase-3 subunit epsilon
VAIREYQEHSGRTDIHVFDQWCHIATVSDPAELDSLGRTRQALAFDLDTYRLLQKRLGHGSARDAAVFQLPAARDESA